VRGKKKCNKKWQNTIKMVRKGEDLAAPELFIKGLPILNPQKQLS